MKMNNMGDLSTSGLEKALSADAKDENLGIATLLSAKNNCLNYEALTFLNYELFQSL